MASVRLSKWLLSALIRDHTPHCRQLDKQYIQEFEKFRVSVMATAGCNAAASLKLNLLKRAGV